MNTKVFSALFAGIMVALTTILSEYLFSDLTLVLKITLNGIAAIIGALLGTISSEYVNKKE